VDSLLLLDEVEEEVEALLKPLCWLKLVFQLLAPLVGVVNVKQVNVKEVNVKEHE